MVFFLKSQFFWEFFCKKKNVVIAENVVLKKMVSCFIFLQKKLSFICQFALYVIYLQYKIWVKH